MSHGDKKFLGEYFYGEEDDEVLALYSSGQEELSWSLLFRLWLLSRVHSKQFKAIKSERDLLQEVLHEACKVDEPHYDSDGDDLMIVEKSSDKQNDCLLRFWELHQRHFVFEDLYLVWESLEVWTQNMVRAIVSQIDKISNCTKMSWPPWFYTESMPTATGSSCKSPMSILRGCLKEALTTLDVSAAENQSAPAPFTSIEFVKWVSGHTSESVETQMHALCVALNSEGSRGPCSRRLERSSATSLLSFQKLYASCLSNNGFSVCINRGYALLRHFGTDTRSDPFVVPKELVAISKGQTNIIHCVDSYLSRNPDLDVVTAWLFRHGIHPTRQLDNSKDFLHLIERFADWIPFRSLCHNYLSVLTGSLLSMDPTTELDILLQITRNVHGALKVWLARNEDWVSIFWDRLGIDDGLIQRVLEVLHTWEVLACSSDIPVFGTRQAATRILILVDLCEVLRPSRQEQVLHSKLTGALKLLSHFILPLGLPKSLGPLITRLKQKLERLTKYFRVDAIPFEVYSKSLLHISANDKDRTTSVTARWSRINASRALTYWGHLPIGDQWMGHVLEVLSRGDTVSSLLDDLHRTMVLALFPSANARTPLEYVLKAKNNLSLTRVERMICNLPASTLMAGATTTNADTNNLFRLLKLALCNTQNVAPQLFLATAFQLERLTAASNFEEVRSQCLQQAQTYLLRVARTKGDLCFIMMDWVQSELDSNHLTTIAKEWWTEACRDIQQSLQLDSSSLESCENWGNVLLLLEDGEEGEHHEMRPQEKVNEGNSVVGKQHHQVQAAYIPTKHESTIENGGLGTSYHTDTMNGINQPARRRYIQNVTSWSSNAPSRRKRPGEHLKAPPTESKQLKRAYAMERKLSTSVSTNETENDESGGEEEILLLKL